MKFLIYLLIGGVSSVFYRVGLKLNTIDQLWSMVFIGLGMTVLGIISILLVKKELILPAIDNPWGLLLTVIGGFGGTLMTVYAMQDGVNMTTLLPAYTIVSLIFVGTVGVLYFGEKVSITQRVGIGISLAGIYLIASK